MFGRIVALYCNSFSYTFKKALRVRGYDKGKETFNISGNFFKTRNRILTADKKDRYHCWLAY